jgi:hypothetical protein
MTDPTDANGPSENPEHRCTDDTDGLARSQRLPDVKNDSLDPQDRPWTQVLETLRAAGEQEGRQAADWWEQDAIGGRTNGDVHSTARAVLAGIDDGDPAILDSLPSFDVAGYDAERFHLHTPGDAPRWDDLPEDDQAEAIDAARDGFHRAIHDGIAAYCRALLDIAPPERES